MDVPIRDLAKDWLHLDRDEATRKEIEDLLAANDAAGLESRLRKRMTFGTAGLRSSMKAGFAHMNSLTVLQASHGLASYVLSQGDVPERDLHDEPFLPTIVVGYDGRHNSEKFARLAAAAFLSHGFGVHWFGQFVHTPFVPFAVRSRTQAIAGIMVTASHNPKDDNGYKVYWRNGCQIIPPHDEGIAQAIRKIRKVTTWDTSLVDDHENVENVFDRTYDLYFERIEELVGPVTLDAEPEHFTYTALHGVGFAFMMHAAEMIGTQTKRSTELEMGMLAGMLPVWAQMKPDPEFPTVPFPNPEEKGALDLAKAQAESMDCNIVLANDPDADRFAAAQLVDGEWHQFTGNQMGVLLASYVYETYRGTTSEQRRGTYLGDKSKLAMFASTVSSRMLSVMAKKEGFRFQETLTGFKWLGNAAIKSRWKDHKPYLNPVFAYEEAIGYMFPSVVYDKDGIAAAAVFLAAREYWRKQGLTPWHKLQQLYEMYGYFEDANTYLISPSPDMTNKVFGDIRTLNDGARPEKVGERVILRWRDLTKGYESGTPDNKPALPVDSSAQMITCELEDIVFTARGSGTEPKIKLYIEATGDDSEKAKVRANSVLQDLLAEWFKPDYGLRLAGT